MNKLAILILLMVFAAYKKEKKPVRVVEKDKDTAINE